MRPGPVRRALVLAMAVTVVAGPVPAVAQAASVSPVSGRLLDGSGRPLGGHVVVLSENRGIANDIFGSVGVVFSLGLSCVAGADPCRSSGSSRVDTDGDGRFVFDEAQVAQALGHSHGVILAAGDPTTEGTVTVRLNPSLGGGLGDVPLWDPRASVAASGAAVTVKWTAPPTSDGSTVVAASVTDGVPSPTNRSPAIYDAVRQNGVRGGVDLDARGWEDRAAAMRLSVGFHRARAKQNPRIDWLARPVPLPTVGAPLSRGAPCRIAGLPDPQTCPLTDGDLFTVLTPAAACPARVSTTTGPACGAAAAAATVDLGRAVSAGAVVVRPAVPSTASVSSDGISWRPLTAGRGAGLLPGTVFDAHGPTWRYVRVGGGTPAEVSVWPAGTLGDQRGFASPPVAGLATTPGATTSGGRSRSRHGVPAWLLGLALLLLGLVIGFLASARLRTLRDSA